MGFWSNLDQFMPVSGDSGRQVGNCQLRTPGRAVQRLFIPGAEMLARPASAGLFAAAYSSSLPNVGLRASLGKLGRRKCRLHQAVTIWLDFLPDFRIPANEFRGTGHT